MTIVDWIFLGPAKIVALSPWGVVGGAMLMIGLQCAIDFRRHGVLVADTRFFRHAAVFTGLLWLIYVAYELQMGAAFALAGAAVRAAPPLRWDLLVLTPILLGMTAMALTSLGRQLRSKQ